MDWPVWIEAIGALVTAAFTGILAVATIRLWNSTKGLHEETQRLANLAESQSADMKASIEVARRAADAAELSARAAIGVELPILRIEELNFTPAIPENTETIAKWCSEFAISIKVKNYGRTQAFLKSYCIAVTIGKPPEVPVYTNGELIPQTSVVETNEVCDLDSTFFFSISDKFTLAQLGSLTGKRPERLFIFGYVTYEDFIHDTHTVGFIYRALTREHAFRISDYAQYEYHKTDPKLPVEI